MKYFIGADIEAPHFSFYAELDDDEDFAGKWSWADSDGLPQKEIGVIFFDTEEDALDAVAKLSETGAGLGQHAETIQVVPLDLD